MTHTISPRISHIIGLARYVPRRASLAGAIILGVLAPAVALAWGPSDRPTYTMQHAATKPVFDSITNNPVQGDERNFMQIREAGQPNSAYADSVSLKPSTEYVVYVYYHNDANRLLNGKDYTGKGVAHGAYVKTDFPDDVKDGQTGVNAEGYVGATNATPKQVFDEVTFSNHTGSDLSLSYVAGSATIHNKNATDGRSLSDSIATSGAPIGWKTLDGTIPACSDYSGYVTLRYRTGPAAAKPTPAAIPSFTAKKEVRLKGTTAWHASVSAAPGDTVEYLATYTNTGSTPQRSVSVRDTLPAHVTYVTGSSRLTNGQNPSGKAVGDGVVTSKGIDIGDYAGGGVGYLLFGAKINGDVPCGTTTLTNGVSITSDNVSKGDTADVTVTKACATSTGTTNTPTPPPTTTPPVVTTAPPNSAIKPIRQTPAQSTPAPAATAQSQAAASAEVTVTQPVTAEEAPAAAATTAPTAAPSAPEQTLPAATPSTGPGSLVGSAFGAGSLSLGAHYYMQSRRTLRTATLK